MRMSPPRPTGPSHPTIATPKHAAIVAGLMAVTAVLLSWGIVRDLPRLVEADEVATVRRAVVLAATGDLNPRWFGHPGSTYHYPLAAVVHVAFAARHDGRWLGPDPRVLAEFDAHPEEYVLLGRWLSVLFAVLALPLVVVVGSLAFGPRIGFAGAWLYAISPVALGHTVIVRDDTAGVFFGTLALWLCIRAAHRPTLQRHAAAGAAIGAATATRYFLAAILPAFVVVDAVLAWRARKAGASVRSVAARAAAACGAAAAGFAATTPYFVLDFDRALASLRFEARTVQVGFDGLGRAGNAWWYASHAIPGALSWPIVVLAGAGLVLALRMLRRRQLFLAGFAAVFAAGICLLPLHWQRWLIPILPTIALFAAAAVNEAAARVAVAVHRPGRSTERALVLAAVAVLSVQPLSGALDVAAHGRRPSTRLQAKAWLEANLPAGSKVAVEPFTLPLDEGRFVVADDRALSAYGSVAALRAAGFGYAVVNETLFEGPARKSEKVGGGRRVGDSAGGRDADNGHAGDGTAGDVAAAGRAADVYAGLERSATLVRVFRPERLCGFEPSTFCGGPVLKVYGLGDLGGGR